MTTELATRDNGSVMQRATTAYTLAEMRGRVEQLDACYRGLMQRGTDYDVIPGTNKPTLYQPGAQLLCTFFGLAPVFELLPGSVEDWAAGFFALSARCRLLRADGTLVAEGIGSCNSKEDKYRWRDQQPQCPACDAYAIRRSKQEWGGGYYCNQKAGGCNARFRQDSPEAAQIATQPAGRIENPEPWSLHNTILKMAEKRALVAATLNASGASRIFTQDVEDLPEFSRGVVAGTVLDTAEGVSGETAGPAAAPESAAGAGWSPALRNRWRAGVLAAENLGVEPPPAPPDGAARADIQAQLRQFGAAVVARQVACDGFKALTDEAVALGIDVEVLDPATMDPATLASVHESLMAMVVAGRGAVGQASPAAPADDDGPF